MTHVHHPTAWQVPNTCARPYHPGSGSHVQLLASAVKGLWKRLWPAHKGSTAMSCWLAPIRAKQLSMAATARLIWLCACLRYWPNRGLKSLALIKFVNANLTRSAPHFKSAVFRFSIWHTLLRDFFAFLAIFCYSNRENMKLLTYLGLSHSLFLVISPPPHE